MSIQFIKDGENLIILIPIATEEDVDKASNLVKLLYSNVTEKTVSNDIQKVTVVEEKPVLEEKTPFFLIDDDKEEKKDDATTETVVEEPNHSVSRLEELGNHTISFGQKYKGKTIKSVAEIDLKWIEFIVNSNYTHDEANLIREYYNLINEK